MKVVVHRLVGEMGKRPATYSTLPERFHIFLDRSLLRDEIVSKAKALIEMHPSDPEKEFDMSFFSFDKILRAFKVVISSLCPCKYRPIYSIIIASISNKAFTWPVFEPRIWD